MIKCLGSMVSALPMYSDAPGNVPEGMKRKSNLCRQKTTGRWNLPSLTPISMSFEWGLSKQELLLMFPPPPSSWDAAGAAVR